MRKNIYVKNPVVKQHLQQQPNTSEYIERLVLRDINTKEDEYVKRSDVVYLIQDYLLKFEYDFKKQDRKQQVKMQTKETDYKVLEKSIMGIIGGGMI